MRRAGVVAALLLVAAAARVSAHPLNPALLEVRELGDGACEVRWRVPVGAPVNAPIRPSLPPDWRLRDEATTELLQAGQSLATRWRVDCAPSGLAGARLGVDGLDERRTDALLRIALADGRTLQTVLRAAQPSYVVPARGSALAVARAYALYGMRHILGGPDHLLFVLGLLLLVRGRRQLLATVTAFTLGHSVTLSLATLGLVRVPPRPIEVLIALSIFVVGVELARPPERRRLGARPWRLAAAFGLLHGLGFAGALADVGLPPGEIPLALAAFNVGIELGQLAFVAVALLFVQRRAWLTRPLAYAIGSLAAFWIFDRL